MDEAIVEDIIVETLLEVINKFCRQSMNYLLKVDR